MRYEFQNHPDKEGWYLVTDTKWMLSCAFKRHEFNETQEFDYGRLPADSAKAAEAMRELGDWLSLHHYWETMPPTVYELRLREDDERISLIRHKDPKFILTSDAASFENLQDALVKAVEFMRKRAGR